MFVAVESYSLHNPHVIRIDAIIAIYYATTGGRTIITTGTNDYSTKLSTLEVLALIKEVQMSSAVDYILRQEK